MALTPCIRLPCDLNFSGCYFRSCFSSQLTLPAAMFAELARKYEKSDATAIQVPLAAARRRRRQQWRPVDSTTDGRRRSLDSRRRSEQWRYNDGRDAPRETELAVFPSRSERERERRKSHVRGRRNSGVRAINMSRSIARRRRRRAA